MTRQRGTKNGRMDERPGPIDDIPSPDPAADLFGEASIDQLADPSGSKQSSRRHLVGREGAFGELEALWTKVALGGERAIALVSGPDGFGKSAVLQHFLANVSGSVVLQAACEEDERSIDFGVLGQLLRGIDIPSRSTLSTLGHGIGEDLDPLRVGAALLETFDELGTNGLVIAVDDLQWADPQSIRALVFALRRLWRAPVFSVLCCDPAGLGRLPVSLDRLLNDVAVRVDLAPLGMEDVGRLASQMGIGPLSRAGIARLVEYSGGSPLHVTALSE